MTDISKLARQFTTAYAAAAPYKQALASAVSEAQVKLAAFACANDWHNDWEYWWFSRAEGITFGAEDINEGGIYLSYSIGQECPTEDYLPFELLSNLDDYLAATNQRLREQRTFNARAAKDRKRAELVRQLAELDGDE